MRDSIIQLLAEWADEDKRDLSLQDILEPSIPSNAIRPIKLATVTVPKGWGHELHVCSNDEFCGKELHVKAGHRFSVHMHRLKREVFRCRTGLVRLTTVNMEDASQLTTVMKPGDVIEIPRLLPHSIEAIEDSIIDEYSTQDRIDDSYRIAPGSSQQAKTS